MVAIAINSKDRQATKLKRSMRLFRSKQRGGDAQRKQEGQKRLQSIPSGELEARTDVTNRKDGQQAAARELSNGTTQQPQASPKRRTLIKSPTSRSAEKESSPRSHRRTESNHSQQTNLSQQSSKSNTSRNSRATTTTSKQHQPDKRLRSSPKQQRPSSSSAGPKVVGSGDGPKVKSPPSILHRHSHFAASPSAAQKQKPLSATAPPPPNPNYEMSPLPAFQNARVRFLSSGAESVASGASQVHLMAGTAGSVASSSAMSSSADNRENVFDRVLHMVMAEEHERLNAMGMSDRAHPKSDAAAKQRSAKMIVAKKVSEKKERFRKADAEAKAVVDSIVGESGESGSMEDDLGLAPPDRMDLAPIDIDTGLEIGGSYDAPIDMDTGLEVHHKSPIDMDTGLEVEYHDLNDDEVDEERWKRLNEKALTSGMEGLSVGEGRRSRSYDNNSRQHRPPPAESNHNRAPSGGSDPDGYRRTNSASGSRGDKSTKKRGSKKTKKFWEKSKDFQTDEWVAFGNQGDGRDRSRPVSASPGRVDDVAAF